MTEEEWLAEQDDPYKMVNFLRERVKPRKARLFACACFRHPKRSLEQQELRAIEVGEKAADGMASSTEIQEAEDEFVGSRNGVGWIILATDWWCAVEAARAAGEWEKEALQCNLTRDIFGNPFRPVAVDPAWLTSTVTQLARGIYEDRAFDRMPILADALQDAGCDNDDVLTHCRDESATHVRGCWVVDLLLSKT